MKVKELILVFPNRGDGQIVITDVYKIMKRYWLIIVAFLIYSIIEAKETKHSTTKTQILSSMVKRDTLWMGDAKNGVTKISCNGLWGLMDSTGTIICKPKYDKIFEMHTDLTIVLLNGKYGVINDKGKEIVAPSLAFIDDYFDHRAWVLNEKNGKWGCFDEKGHLIIDFNYQSVSRFCNGYALCLNDDVYELVSKSNKLIYKVPKIYVSSYRESFFLDKVWVSEQKTNIERKVNKQKIEKYSNSLPSYFHFNENIAAIPAKIKDELRFVFINTNGQQVIKSTYEDVKLFQNGLAPVKEKGKWGLIDLAGRQKIEFQYDSIEYATQDLFIVVKNGLYGIINSKNINVFPSHFKKIEYVLGTLFSVLETTHTSFTTRSYLDSQLFLDSWSIWGSKTNIFLNQEQYDRILPVNENFFLAIKYSVVEQRIENRDFFSLRDHFARKPISLYNIDQRIQVINKNGEFLGKEYEIRRETIGTTNLSISEIGRATNLSAIDDDYYYMFLINNTLLFLDQTGVLVKDSTTIDFLLHKNDNKVLLSIQDKKTGKYGVRDGVGDNIIRCNYDSIGIEESGFILLSKDKYGFADLAGKIILEPIYDSVQVMPDGMIKVRSKDYDYYFLNKSTRTLIPVKQ